MNFAAKLIDKASQIGVTLTTAESCTGGLISAALTDVAGSSAVFERGYVTYSNAAKIDMLNVTAQSLSAYGAVSEEVAAEMANGALQKAQADIAVSVTGIAGPGGSDHKPEGMVCFSIATRIGTMTETQLFGPLGRTEVRSATVQRALELALQTIDSIASKT
jgi:nicotinamide-nucleotide amidase